MSLLHWSTPDLALTFALDDGPVRLVAVRETTQPDGPLPDPSQPLVEISAIGYGHSKNRHANTVLGQRLRYVRHEDSETTLRIQQEDPETGLLVTSVFEARAGVRTWSEASMTGPGTLELTFLSSLVVGLESVDAELYSAANSWMAESRWSVQQLRAGELADIVSEGHQHVANTRHAVTSTNSWSCGERLPIGVLVDRGTPYALGWQIEHNGPWHYELGESRRGGYLLLSGPTDLEHQWTVELTEDKPFTSVPVSLVAGTDRDSVFAALTRQRRAIRQRRPIDDRMPVVFNDYMNTLLGDPTTEKLLPLIDAAAEAGADYFCIDAGWYAEGNWWDTVGAWQPSTTRFPNGLAEVIQRIHDRGMVPGLWLEPEVIGMRSPIADELPDDAFLTRRGIRVAEGGRYLLDLRSAAARQASRRHRRSADRGVRCRLLQVRQQHHHRSWHRQGRYVAGPRAAGTQPRDPRLARRSPDPPPGPADRELRFRRDADGLRDAVPAPPAVDLRPGRPVALRTDHRGSAGRRTA